MLNGSVGDWRLEKMKGLVESFPAEEKSVDSDK